MPRMTQAADITAGRCGAPAAGRWCVLVAGHKLGRGRSHRATPRTAVEVAAARAFAELAGDEEPPLGGEPPPGGELALCAQVDPELFYPERAGSAEEMQAKAICRKCELRRKCLQWALETRELYGVWGGASQAERRVMLRHGRPGRCTDPDERSHGTRGRYEKGPDENDVPGRGCRCLDCQRANADAERHRDQETAAGRWQPYVDAGPALAWVLMLKDYGIGWKRVAALAGVSAGTVNALVYGRRGRRSRRIRPEADAAIRAVLPVLDNLADTTIIDPAGTRLLLQALVAAGWPQRWLARRLGWQWAYFGSVMARKKHIAAGAAKAVVALYRDLQDQLPPQDTAAQNRAVTNARAVAERHGWTLLPAEDAQALSGPQADHGNCWRPQRRPPAEAA